MAGLIYFGGHQDAGFFIHALNTYYGGINLNGNASRIQQKNIELLSDAEIDSIECASLVIPILDEWRLETATSIFQVLRKSLVNAINQKRCTLIFDFSNEAGNDRMLERLSSILIQSGVLIPRDCWLICQNRILDSRNDNLVRPIPFDFFLLAGASASIKNFSVNGEDNLVKAIADNSKPYQITCLNATPRIHRIHTILELLDQNLFDLSLFNQQAAIKCPYISLPLLNDSKGDPLTSGEVFSYLSLHQQDHLGLRLSWLISVLPLKVDEFSEHGNQLATKIDFNHFLKSNMSVITETGVNKGIERITEKTMKALVHGHPFVVIGHMNSVRLARSLGYSTMDDFIDHSYDSIDDPVERIHAAICSAKDFIENLRNHRIDSRELSEHARHNIIWGSKGFFAFYWHQYVRPILEILQLPASMPTATNLL